MLKQADLPERKMEQLERILEKGLSGAANQETVEKSADEIRKEKDKKMNEDRGNDGN